MLRTGTVLSSIALAACVPGAKIGGSPAQFGYPRQDVLFDCELREADDARLPPESWSARNDRVERFGWLLSGSATPEADADTGPMQYSGDTSIFYSEGVYRSFVDWPKRVEFGTASSTGRDANREDEFKTLTIDMVRHRARVVVTNSEWPHGGGDDDRFITGGSFGECSLVEGEAATRQFENIE